MVDYTFDITISAGECLFLSLSNHLSQINSCVVSARARYSGSEVDLEASDCFLLPQEVRESPRKKHNHVVEHLVNGSPPQSASE